MKRFEWILLLGALSLAFVCTGCKDSSTPSTLADQQKLVRGSSPTPEQLQKAMGGYKFGKPGDKPVATPPDAGGGR